MTQQDYEQKKRECLDEFCKRYRIEEPSEQNIESFDWIFDRAYALGKQTETISREEIEKAAKKYAAEVDKNVCDLYGIENPPASLTFGECAAESFREGVNFALGKQAKDAENGSLWSRLTDEEKREMQCRYHTNECVLRDHKKRTGDKAQSKAVTRMRLLENLFGKGNLKVEKK